MIRRFTDLRLGVLVLVGTLSLIALLAAGCGDDQSPVTPQSDQETSRERGSLARGPVLDLRHADVQAMITVQERHTPDLMSNPDVVGTAVGLDDRGELAVKIYVTEAMNEGTLPASLEGAPVVVVRSGELVARKGRPPKPGDGDDPQAKQTPPVKMGTSGGWRYDLANGYCCGGTLGSLIQIGSSKYVLSNYHVLYADIVSGGNNRTAQAGDPVIQPGLIDVGCNAANAQDIATLVNNGGSLPGANVDAGIAQVISGMVDETGAILSIGTISSQTAGAFVGQAVKKMGRTTGLARADVDGLNATVSITYSNECAGGTSFTKTFTGQIITTNNRCKFLDGGDSGSLMVEDVTTNPRAVGLLYAGSVTCNRFAVAVANPIDDVLGHYNASMVGN